MALTFFSDNQRQSGNSVFYTEWLEENPRVKTLEFPVTELKLVQSGKGYLAITEFFTYFIWKNSKETKLLLEAMKVYVKEPNKGHPIYLVRKKITDEKLSLAADLDTEITWFEGKGVYTTSEESLDSEKTTDNPFLS